jgi:hypothetical protein
MKDGWGTDLESRKEGLEVGGNAPLSSGRADTRREEDGKTPQAAAKGFSNQS